MAGQKDRKVLLVMASEAFDDQQYKVVRESLEKIGVTVETASTVPAKARGLQGLLVDPDLIIDNVQPDDYAGVVFIGGHGCSQYWHDVYAHEIVRNLHSRKLPIAAIGRAPVVLGVAGVIRDRKTTGSVAIFEKMVLFSKTFTGNKLEVDDNIITAEGSSALGLFADAIVSKLAQKA